MLGDDRAPSQRYSLRHCQGYHEECAASWCSINPLIQQAMPGVDCRVRGIAIASGLASLTRTLTFGTQCGGCTSIVCF